VLIYKQLEQAAERRPEMQDAAFDRDEMRLQRDFTRSEKAIADAEAIQDPEKRVPLVLAVLRTRTRLLQRSARMYGYDRNDDAESMGKGIGSSLGEQLRTMSDEELDRELAAYQIGVDDGQKMDPRDEPLT
jgi:hypothetical protein